MMERNSKCNKFEPYSYLVEELVDDVIFDLMAGNTVTIVVKNDYAGEIIRDIMAEVDDIEIGLLYYEKDEYSAYEDEYLITLTDDRELFVEKAYNPNSSDYVTFEADIVYVHENCSDEITLGIRGTHFFVCNFNIVEESVLDFEEEEDFMQCDQCAYRNAVLDQLGL